MIKNFFDPLGIDWFQFKHLLLVNIKMDFRENRGIGTRKKKKISPLISSLIFYAGMGLILAANLVTKVDPFMYSVLILAYTMVMSGFSVILESGNSILNPDDWDVLTHRPVNSKTYFLAKVSNLLFYVILITSAMCILPALLGIGVRGNTLFFPFIFIPVSYMASITTASFVILIYTLLLQKINYQKFKDIIAYFQIGFSLLLFLFYQMIPRLGNEFFLTDKTNFKPWFYLMPPAWFTGIIHLFYDQTENINYQLGLIGICISIIFILFAFKKISLQYTALIANSNAATVSSYPGKTKTFLIKGENIFLHFIRSFLKDPESAAGFDVTTAMCKKDRSVKMGIYPLLGIPLAFLGLAIFENEFKDPLIHGLFPGQGITLLIIFIFMMMYSLTMLMKYSNDWEASWIFRLAPIESAGKLYQGVKYAIFIRYILPFFLLLFIVYSVFIPPLHAMHFVLSLFLFCLFFNSLISFQINTYPFSEKRQKGERMRRFTFIIFVGPMFGLYALLYTYIFKEFTYWLIGQIIILSLWRLFENLSVKKIDKNLHTINSH
ncbi:MAG: hypothetical protein R6V04_16450 [bacterium]